jgi:glycosyltransferase involved in cell wall biosynthesis
MDLSTRPTIPTSTAPPGPDGLRILAFCDYFSPKMGGGAERVANEVYRRLAYAGSQITVVTTETRDGGWRGLHPNIEVISVPTADLRRAVGLQVAVTWGAARVGRQLARSMRPDVIHANSLEFQTSIAAARVSRQLEIPMVLTAHIAGFADLPRRWRGAGKTYEWIVARRLLTQSRLVIAVSDAVAAYVRRWPEIDDRVRIVPNGVNHDVFSAADEPERRGPTKIVFVGRQVKNKGPQILLAAARLLLQEGDQIRVSFVGDGPMGRSLQRRIDRDPLLRPAVSLDGSTDDVAARLHEADVLVRPGLTEGMPLAVLEAMASGLCVVASDVPGNRSLIEHGTTGFLFQAGSIRSLADVLRRVVSDQHERDRVSRAAHLRSIDFSWDRCAGETLQVLLEAVSGPTTKDPAMRTAR